VFAGLSIFTGELLQLTQLYSIGPLYVATLVRTAESDTARSRGQLGKRSESQTQAVEVKGFNP